METTSHRAARRHRMRTKMISATTKAAARTSDPSMEVTTMARVIAGEENWCTKARTESSKRWAWCWKTCSASQEKRNSASMEAASEARTTARMAGAGRGARSICGSWESGVPVILPGGNGQGTRRNVTGDQLVELGKQRGVAGTRIRGQSGAVMVKVEQEGFHAFLVEIVPESADVHFCEVVGVERLLELVLHRHGQIWLAKMQRFADERETGIGNDSFRRNDVVQKRVEAWLLEQKVAVTAFAIEAIADETFPDVAEKRGKIGRGRGHIDEDVIAHTRARIKDFVAQQRWKYEGSGVADRRVEKRNDKVSVGAGRHAARDQLGGGSVGAVVRGQGNPGIEQQVLVVDGDDRQAPAAREETRERLEVGAHQVNLPIARQTREPRKAGARLWGRQQVLDHRAAVAHAIVHVGKAQSEDLGDGKVAAEIHQPAVEGHNMDVVTL